MKVILEKRVEKLGLPGEIVDVANGYARNFLIPKKFASKATDETIERVKKKVKKLNLAYVKEIEEVKKVVAEIEKLTITLAVVAGEKDKLFGAVTNHQIADVLEKKGITVDKKKVLIASPIKQLGEYQVEIKIHADVSASLKVIIEKKTEE